MLFLCVKNADGSGKTSVVLFIAKCTCLVVLPDSTAASSAFEKRRRHPDSKATSCAWRRLVCDRSDGCGKDVKIFCVAAACFCCVCRRSYASSVSARASCKQDVYTQVALRIPKFRLAEFRCSSCLPPHYLVATSPTTFNRAPISLHVCRKAI